jgi:hypothetical protein
MPALTLKGRRRGRQTPRAAAASPRVRRATEVFKSSFIVCSQALQRWSVCQYTGLCKAVFTGVACLQGR